MSFQEWLLEEIKNRGWSQSELARRANISRASISNILSKTRQPGPEVCEAISRALHIPAEIVFYKAGLLPHEIKKDEQIEEIQNIYNSLDDHGKVEILEQARLRLRIQEEQGGRKPRAATDPRPAQ
jgi:transcriptional regulator with XRE-family HTH domain